MSVEDNKAAVRNYFASLNRDQNMNGLGAMAAAGFRSHFPGADADLAGTQGFGNGFFAAFPGLQHKVYEVFGEDDFVGARMTITGTHTQPFQMPNGAIPATGAEIRLEVLNQFRFEGDKVAEQWSAFDLLRFMQSLGVIPS